MLDFSTFESKHGVEHIYAKRFRYRLPLDAGPRIATLNHPRLSFESSTLIDALAAFALSFDMPFDWNAVKDRNDGLERFIAESRAVGLSGGLIVPIRLSQNIAYVWELTRTAPSGFNIIETTEIIGELHALSAHDNADYAARNSQSGSQLLTPRETEVLDWYKQGKTYAEIGEIMGISSKTVDYLMVKAMRRLGANNKLAAVIEAIKNDIF